MKRNVKCSYTRIWDGVSEVVQAVYDQKTGYIDVTTTGFSSLRRGTPEKEFITLPDEDELAVCPACHEYTLKTFMVASDYSKDLFEVQGCSNRGCSNQP